MQFWPFSKLSEYRLVWCQMKALLMANTVLVTKTLFCFLVVSKRPKTSKNSKIYENPSLAKCIGFFSQQRGDNGFSLTNSYLLSKELSFDTQQAYILIILKMAKIALGDL